jgi:phospholipid/cholesterol/gamma-HCH transport system permease protein
VAAEPEPAADSKAAMAVGLASLRAGAISSLSSIGDLYVFAIRCFTIPIVRIARGKFAYREFTREFIEQAWFIASVCILPTILIAIPFGLIIALEVGNIARQVGATSYIGAVDALGTLREAAPIVTALLLAGAGGSAICADLGARTIKDEVEALKVMGLDPVERWIAPRVLAALVVAMLLNGIVAFVGIISGYVFFVNVLHGTPGTFLGSFSSFATPVDIVVSTVKAGIFGTLAAIVAAYKGMGVKRGAAGVGMAVNESVVLTGILLFAVNVIISQLYYALFPPRIT